MTIDKKDIKTKAKTSAPTSNNERVENFPDITESTDPIIKRFHDRAREELQEKVDWAKPIDTGGYSQVIGLDQGLAYIMPMDEPESKGKPFSLADYKKIKKAEVYSPFLQAIPLSLDEKSRRLVPRGKMDLQTWLSSRGRPLNEQEVAQIALQVLLGLKTLHDRGLAHLDLKLENIILMEESPPFVMVGDIGAAKINSDNQIEGNCNFPTTHEIVPEEIKESTVSRTGKIEWHIDYAAWRKYPKQIDIHGYGIILSELLKGTKFYNDDLNKIIEGAKYKEKNQLSLGEILKMKCWEIALEDYRSSGDSQEKAISNLIEFYEKKLISKMEGFYYNAADGYGLNSPLQSAPADIREVVLKYESLQNKINYFIDLPEKDFKSNSQLLIDASIALKHISMQSDELSKSHPSFKAILKENSSYDTELTRLSDSLQCKKDMFKFIEDFRKYLKIQYDIFSLAHQLLNEKSGKLEKSYDEYQKLLVAAKSLESSIKESHGKWLKLDPENILKKKCCSILDTLGKIKHPKITHQTSKSASTSFAKFWSRAPKNMSQKTPAKNEKEDTREIHKLDPRQG